MSYFALRSSHADIYMIIDWICATDIAIAIIAAFHVSAYLWPADDATGSLISPFSVNALPLLSRSRRSKLPHVATRAMLTKWILVPHEMLAAMSTIRRHAAC